MSTELRINYIASFYVGPNRTFPYYQKAFKEDPLYFVYRHIEFSNFAENISKFTFVINDDIADDLKDKIYELTHNKNIEICFRQNSGYSYGAWNEIVSKNLKSYDYFFLIEDDYIPSITNFTLPFLQRFKNNTAYVCSLMVEINNKINEMVPKDIGQFKHPSISNGMLSAKVCNQVLEKYKTLFRLQPGITKEIGYWNQIYFLKNFTDLGYDISDTTDEFSSPYMNTLTGDIKIFGNPEKQPLIVPIQI